MSEETTIGAEKPDAIDIFYDKSPQFRTIHPGGAWASITPELEVQIVFFTNLAPVPEYIRQKVTEQGGLGEEIDKIVKKGISREYEVGIILNKLVAIQVVELLNKMIAQLPQAEVQYQVVEGADKPK
jgi:hypothetical protein